MSMNPANIVRLIILALAIIGAFVAIPYAALILVVLGLIMGFIGVAEDRRIGYFLVALVLATMGGALAPIPVAGDYLTTILGGISTAVSAGAIAVVLTIIYERFKA